MSRQQEVEQANADVDFEKNRYQINLETSKGNIKLDLLPDVAPNHCLNMMGLAKLGFYDGLIFHRVIKGFMIQGGCPEGTGTGGPGYNVKAEFNSTPHTKGVLSMARSASPDSAGCQFFICLETASHLDNQYTAFGKAADADSQAVVDAIGDVSVAASDRPLEDVKIISATVTESPK